MRIRDDTWYFLRGYAGKSEQPGINNGSPKVYCNKNEFDVFLLVNREVLSEIQYEEEVSGYSAIPTFRTPYPVYAVAVNTDNIQPILDKYEVEAVWEKKGPGVITI